MVQLVAMVEKEFESFMIISKKDQIEGQVQAGDWKAEEAQGNMEQLLSQFLPNGLTTVNHKFFTIKETSTDASVGGLWYMIMEEAGIPQIFVMDIQIYDEYKRHGYGSQAFLAMEEKVRETGITTIALHVFKNNHSARAMYEKLGYRGTNTTMIKNIDL